MWKRVAIFIPTLKEEKKRQMKMLTYEVLRQRQDKPSFNERCE